MKYIWRLWVLLSSCDYEFCSSREPASWLFWACVDLFLNSVGVQMWKIHPASTQDPTFPDGTCGSLLNTSKGGPAVLPVNLYWLYLLSKGVAGPTYLHPGHRWMRTLIIFSLLDHRRRTISVVVGGLSSHRAGLLSDREVIWTPGLLEAHVRKSGIHGALTNPHSTGRGWLGSLM